MLEIPHITCNHTTNDSTTQVGICLATVIARTENPMNHSVVTTMELVYPRFIHSEFMTHRMFSRNASSSRAIPVKRLIDEATVIPVHWMKNCKGMSNPEEITDEEEIKKLSNTWLLTGLSTKVVAVSMAQDGLHKQIVNRLLEPFSYIKVVVTATDWDNFFKLRLAPDAEPHIRDLAKAMKESMEKVKPTIGFIHAPYCDEGYKTPTHCAARCARVSYNKHDGTKPSYEDDIKLAGLLMDGQHMTPFEHYCYASLKDDYHANLKGWYSQRYKIEHGVENGS